ncbi:MAG: preprotein translocase subunit SecG [Minisyncoccales bacterium]|jgi:protein translocase SecG subunit
MNSILSVLQIIVSVILITLILLQQGESGLGSAFGQEGGSYSTRRGFQKHAFTGTIVFGIIFILLAVFNLLV